ERVKEPRREAMPRPTIDAADEDAGFRHHAGQEFGQGGDFGRIGIVPERFLHYRHRLGTQTSTVGFCGSLKLPLEADGDRKPDVLPCLLLIPRSRTTDAVRCIHSAPSFSGTSHFEPTQYPLATSLSQGILGWHNFFP